MPTQREILQGKTSTRIPTNGVSIDHLKASFKRKGVKITILPDARNDSKVLEGKSATTEFTLDFRNNPMIQHFNNKVLSVEQNSRLIMTIRTYYRNGVKKREPSAYGRGTTDQDKKRKGRTTLRFHESQHGKNFIRYIPNNPPPKFTFTGVGLKYIEGDEKCEYKLKYKEAVEEYAKRLAAYRKSMEEHSKRVTDCVGDKEESCKDTTKTRPH